MTITDLEVTYEWGAEVFVSGLTWSEIPVTNVVMSMDIDRVPYCAATITASGVTEAMWKALDPRTLALLSSSGNIRMWLREYDSTGAFRAAVGATGLSDSTRKCYLFIRDVQYDRVAGTITIQASGGESIMDDKKRLAPTAIDTAAATVYDLVLWSLYDVFTSVSLANDPIVSATAIPAGDRRLMQPGDSFSDLVEPELSAIDCRLYDYWGALWCAYGRNHAPGSYGALPMYFSTFTQDEGAPPVADPIVYEVSETATRNGDFADGVMVTYDMRKFGGTVAYQRSGGGVNTKGRLITWERPAPASNTADQVVTRTVIRGHDMVITARARMDVSPGQTLTVFLRDSVTLTGSIRAVEWDADAGTMTINAQSGQPI